MKSYQGSKEQALDKQYYAKNKAKVDARHRQYYAENKEKCKARKQQFKAENTDYYLKLQRQYDSKRRASILKQTPPDADMSKIREIYLNCPKGYEVDHIIPISKGGLHHQDNLQYLTEHDNRSKGAKV